MKTPLFLLAVLIPIFIQAQPDVGHQIDLKPTKEAFDHAKSFENPTGDQIDTLIQLCFEYSFSSLDSSIILGEKAVEGSRNLEDKSYSAKSLLETGDSFRKHGEVDKAEQYFNEGKKLYESLENLGQIANADNKLGVLHMFKGENEKAMEYFLSALEGWTITKDSQYMFKPYLNISMIQYRLDHIDKALYYTNLAGEWAELTDNDRARMFVYNNSAILKELKALEYVEKDSLSDDYAMYQDSATFFYKQSYDSFDNALTLAKKRNDKGSMINALMNMTELQMDQKQFDQALGLAKEAKPIAMILGESRQIAHVLKQLGRINSKMGNLKDAVRYGEELVEISKEHKMAKEQSHGNGILHNAYKELGIYDKALSNYEAYETYFHEQNDLERNKSIAEIENKYQNAVKEKEIVELKAENQRVERQKWYIIWGSLVLGLLSFLGYKFMKIRKEKNDKKAFVEALIFAQEEERKRIARDLHDGIGQSLLLIKNQMATTQETTVENQKLISETLDEVRTISRDLHPFTLEKFGLTASIKDILQRLESTTDLFVTHDIENVDSKLTAKSEINIYRTIQEGLNNIIKHAEATAAKLDISVDQNMLSIVIQDNGKGYDHEMAIVKSKSLGLKTMYERISSLGGELKIEPNKPSGTLIRIRVPLSK